MLPANVRLDWKVIARYNHSSLLILVVSNEGKTFYTLDYRSPAPPGSSAGRGEDYRQGDGIQGKPGVSQAKKHAWELN